MVKYNEIMNNVTVDPEMKTRIMSAVSAAIKEQNGKTGKAQAAVKTEIKKTPEVRTAPEIRKEPEQAKVSGLLTEEGTPPVRKKARKTPIVVISSIAAGILVIAGVLFVFSKMGMSGATKTAEATAALNTVSNEVNSYMDAAAEAEDEYYAETTAAAAEPESDGDRNYTAGIDSDHGLNGKNSLTTDVHLETAVTTVRLDENDTMGDERLDRLSKVLPFTIKGSGSGMYSDTIAEEVFFGNNGEKVLLFSAPEGTDLINVISLDNSPEGTVSEIIFHQNRTDGVPGTTPEGQAVTYYRVEFGNVTELAEGETSTDVNAAVFNKNGSTYLIIFSDIQPVDVIGSVIDVI